MARRMRLPPGALRLTARAVGGYTRSRSDPTMEGVMVKCFSCRKEVDESAETCPHCGASLTEPVVQEKPHCGTPSVPKT